MKLSKATSKIAVILPTRGQIFSQTFEEILTNLEGYYYEIYWSHNNPIPACFNKPLERALKDPKNTHFWFVEEDMILPTNTLVRMFTMDLPAVACDYPVTDYGQSAISRDPDGKAFFTGTGCLLVTREFLELYPRPIFRADIAWDTKPGPNLVEITPTKAKKAYGFHDITFGLVAYLKGHPIAIAPIKCGQRKLEHFGDPGTNQGQHNIQEWRKVVPFSLFSPVPTDKPETESVNVRLNDGSVALLPLTRAQELVAAGKATSEIIASGYLRVVVNDLTKELLGWN